MRTSRDNTGPLYPSKGERDEIEKFESESPSPLRSGGEDR
jgi:hypothetical protein